VAARSNACWECGFESHQGYSSVSCECFVCVCVFCQVEVSVSVRSLFQRSPIECGVSECDLETSMTRRPMPTRALEPRKKFLLRQLALCMASVGIIGHRLLGQINHIINCGATAVGRTTALTDGSFSP